MSRCLTLCSWLCYVLYVSYLGEMGSSFPSLYRWENGDSDWLTPKQRALTNADLRFNRSLRVVGLESKCPATHPAITFFSSGTWKNHGKMTRGLTMGEDWWKNHTAIKRGPGISRAPEGGRNLSLWLREFRPSCTRTARCWNPDAAMVIQQDSHTAGGVTRKRLQGCYMKISLNIFILY